MHRGVEPLEFELLDTEDPQQTSADTPRAPRWGLVAGASMVVVVVALVYPARAAVELEAPARTTAPVGTVFI